MDREDMDLKEALIWLNAEYKVGLEFDTIDLSSFDLRRARYLKRIADVKMVRQFRVMMAVFNLEVNQVSKMFGINRKYISLILNEKFSHPDLSKKRFFIIVGLMAKLYCERYDLMLAEMEMYFGDKSVDMIKKLNNYIKRMY